MPRVVARCRAISRDRGVLPSIAQTAPAKLVVDFVNGSSGCALNRSCGASKSSGADALQCPTMQFGGNAALTLCIAVSGTHSRIALPVGSATLRPNGPNTVTPAERSACAKALPARPAPTTVKAVTSEMVVVMLARKKAELRNCPTENLKAAHRGPRVSIDDVHSMARCKIGNKSGRRQHEACRTRSTHQAKCGYALRRKPVRCVANHR